MIHYNLDEKGIVFIKMEVYLDNAATTRPYPQAADAVREAMLGNFGNPSSLHALGKRAEDAVTAARQTIARGLGCDPAEVTFTSGGTEGNNLAIIGYCLANRRRGSKIVTTAVEHPAVLEPIKWLEAQGFAVELVKPSASGTVSAADVLAAVDSETILVSCMAVNNETGAVNPIADIAAGLNHAQTALHVDAVQAFGKLDCTIKRLGADLLTVSSHKIHGPNGVGALYARRGVKLSPIEYGGGQERGLRSGTENVAGIVGFALAADITLQNRERDMAHCTELKRQLLEGLSQISGMIVNSPEDALPTVINVSFPPVKAEVLLHVLESQGIFVSTGSACHSRNRGRSHVLTAMGLKNERIDSAIRISLSGENTAEEIAYVVQVLCKEVPILQKVMGK